MQQTEPIALTGVTFARQLLGQLALVDWWPWLGFGFLVVVLLTADLAFFHRQSSEPTLRQAARGTLIWCLFALAFNAYVWFSRGSEAGISFLTGYLLEWSLSMDNVFVFAVLFRYFQVPRKYQYRVLFWGILGAIVMRLTFVLAGKALLEHFDWILFLFGLLLVYQGAKLAWEGDNQIEPERTLIMRLARKLLPIARGDYGSEFFVIEAGKRVITPLFLVLLVIEWTDVIFAVDSVPAIFGITRDAYIIFTSNIFAILGLRALYFLLAEAMDLFHYLKYGLSAVLIFIGLKMVVEYSAHHFFGLPANKEVIPHSNLVSLGVVLGLLLISVVASLTVKRQAEA